MKKIGVRLNLIILKDRLKMMIFGAQLTKIKIFLAKVALFKKIVEPIILFIVERIF